MFNLFQMHLAVHCLHLNCPSTDHTYSIHFQGCSGYPEVLLQCTGLLSKRKCPVTRKVQLTMTRQDQLNCTELDQFNRTYPNPRTVQLKWSSWTGSVKCSLSGIFSSAKI